MAPGCHGEEQVCGGEDQVSRAGSPGVRGGELHRLSGGQSGEPRPVEAEPHVCDCPSEGREAGDAYGGAAAFEVLQK